MDVRNGNNDVLSSSLPIDQAIRLVRAIRLCEKAGIDKVLCKQVRESILTSLADQTQEETEPKVWKEEASHYELKIRQLVQLDATWHQIAPLAWKYYDLKSTSDAAAHILELVFLHGDEQELLAVIERLCRGDQTFYSNVNKAVRGQLLRLFWNNSIGSQLAKILEWQRHERWLIPVERLFVLTQLKKQRDPNVGLHYYDKYFRDIHQAIDLVGPETGIETSAIYLQVARYAVQLGKHSEALGLLNKVSDSDQEYQESMDLILNIDSEFKTAEESDYVRYLVQEPSWQERISLLASFLKATRNNAGIRDRNRASLNLLLRDPLKWVPQEPAAWNQLSQTLMSAADILHLLPSLMTVYEQNALNIFERTLDVALWQPCLQTSAAKLDPYWLGLASLHRYIASHGKLEESLWNARDWMTNSNCDQELHRLKRISWNDVVCWAMEWTAKSRQLLTEDRRLMGVQLAVAGDASMISPDDIQKYLKSYIRVPYAVLTRLESIAKNHKRPELELTLIRCRAQHSHYRNQDLARIFSLAREIHDYDLAWRTCSIIDARTLLDSSVAGAWQISGENRRSYQILLPKMEMIDACLQEFSLDEVRLCKAVIKAGSLIPELMAAADKATQSHKVRPPLAGSLEEIIDERLNQISWMPAPKKIYFHAKDGEGSDNVRIPPFAKRVPNSDWSVLLLRLIDRLGVTAWKWRLSRLAVVLNSELAFKQTRVDNRNFSLRHPRFLRDTTALQRSGLADFRLASKNLTDEEAAICMAKFMCRLATAMYQNHSQAIQSLQNMRVPLPLLRALESWILSALYGELRKQTGTASRVPVPNVIGGPIQP